METKKQKIEIELNIPEEYEFVRYDFPSKDEAWWCDHDHFVYVGKSVGEYKRFIVRPISPPLELESENGLFTKDPLSGYVNTTSDGTLEVGVQDLGASEARDLAKILNYWAEMGKLPERVVVKGGAK